jgi:hypothetical protein
MKIAVVTRLKDGNGHPANGTRVATALQRNGHEVKVVDHSVGSVESLPYVINYTDADVVLVFGTLLSAEHVRPGQFAKLRAMNPEKKIVLWYFDICHHLMKNSPWKFKTLRSVLPFLDGLVTTDHSHPWEKHLPYLHLMQGIDEAEYEVPAREYAKEAEETPKQGVRTPQRPIPGDGCRRDVILTGGINPPFQERNYAVKLLRSVGMRVDVFGRDSGKRVDGRPFLVEHGRSRIALVPAPPSWTPGPYWSNRIYLAAATGTACLVGQTPGIEEHYAPGEVVYFHDRPSLVQAAKDMLKDKDLRDDVGRRGRERTLRDHTYRARAVELVKFIGGL